VAGIVVTEKDGSPPVNTIVADVLEGVTDVIKGLFVVSTVTLESLDTVAPDAFDAVTLNVYV
jgi:hypothetical protein